jgi:hypothetical protein
MLNKLTQFYQEKGLSHVLWQCLFLFFGGLILVSPFIEHSLFQEAVTLLNFVGVVSIICSFCFLAITFWLKNRTVS